MAHRAAFALALVFLALACSSAAADCLSQYGPGCTNCINISLTTGHRRLLRDGKGRDEAHDQPKPPKNETHDDHDGDHHSGSFLTCTECNTPGYVLVNETEHSNVLGRCECAPGWGIEFTTADPLNLLVSKPRPGSFICIDCNLAAQPGVPLLYGSNVTLTYASGAWSLVLGTPKNKAVWNSAWQLEKKRGVPPPPYYRGQCITCPLGSGPNAGNTQCVAL